MKTTVDIRDPLMAEAKAVCALHNITMKVLIERALAAEIANLAATPRWQPTDEFVIHGDVMVDTDVDAEIAAMYEDMMANDFMTKDED